MVRARARREHPAPPVVRTRVRPPALALALALALVVLAPPGCAAPERPQTVDSAPLRTLDRPLPVRPDAAPPPPPLSIEILESSADRRLLARALARRRDAAIACFQGQVDRVAGGEVELALRIVRTNRVVDLRAVPSPGAAPLVPCARLLVEPGLPSDCKGGPGSARLRVAFGAAARPLSARPRGST
ncbi:MAG: hypothetical protein H6711_17470 [Myxococcales bacterium]|nr:hypothetical protein [Myxococcales bacterium]